MFELREKVSDELTFKYTAFPLNEYITLTTIYEEMITLNGNQFDELVKRVQAARDSRDRTIDGSRPVREASVQASDALPVREGEHSDPEC